MTMMVDLVDRGKLFHQFEGDSTIHFIRDKRATREIEIQEWRRQGMIGTGGFGQVWREVLRDREAFKAGTPANKKIRAVKQIAKNREPDIFLRRELKALMHFSQPEYRDHFVEAYGWYETDSMLFIAMEYLPKGDLLKHLTKPLPVLEAKSIAVQILEGLYHMHDAEFTHRDLKPENLLVVTTQPWQVKIADFGLCKQVFGDSTSLRTNAGTALWKAPEYMFFNDPNVKITPAVDIWSFGAIVFNMITGRQPFRHQGEIMEYGTGRSNFPKSDLVSGIAGTACVNFLKSTMAARPEHRLKAYDCLKHPWLKGYLENPSSLARDRKTSSLAKSSNSLENITNVSPGKSSEVSPDGDSSSASGNWENINIDKPTETTELAIREIINGVKTSNVHSSPESDEEITGETDKTVLPPQGKNARNVPTKRSLAREEVPPFDDTFHNLMILRQRKQDDITLCADLVLLNQCAKSFDYWK